MDMMKKLETAFDALKELDIKPTPHNVSILDGVYDLLREIYQGVSDGNTDSPCGQHSD